MSRDHGARLKSSTAPMTFVPLYDNDPAEGKTIPVVTYGLIAINAIVSIAIFSLPPETRESVLEAAGLVPAVELREAPSFGLFPRDLALLTSMFLHLSWLHLAGNMWFLWIFGDNIEDAIGHLRFFFFYFLAGFGGSAGLMLSDPYATIPTIGASGAIAGIMAAYLMLRPCANIRTLFFVYPVNIRAYWFIAAWIVLQVIGVGLGLQSGDQIAYWAHLGGAVTGALLIAVMRPSHVRLFECIAPPEPKTKTNL